MVTANYDVVADLRLDGAKHAFLRDGARIEIGLRNFLTAGNFKAFTDTFEDLHGMTQLPGLAAQRLMRDGYGFGASGDKVLGAHMLEICESIAVGKPKLEIHPLGIGGKADPVRLAFDSQTGIAVCASIMDMGGRYRLVVDVVPTDESLPKHPVARAL